MIELKKLNKFERYKIVRGSQPFFLTYKSPKWQQHVVSMFEDQYGDLYSKSIKLILTCAAKCIRYNSKSIQFSLDRNVFAIANKITKQRISYDKTKELLSKLEKDGYLTVYKGYYKSSSNSLSSCLVFHEKLLNLLDKDLCKKYAVNRTEGLQFVEIVDEELSTKTKKVFKTNSKFKGVANITKEIKLVNKVLSKSKITFDGDVCTVMYKRRFHTCIKQGGRWYVIGSFQTEDSEKRHTIKIDDESCTEIDFKFIHPSIFATLEGIKLEEAYDPYDIKHLLDTDLSKKEVRDFCKIAMMALLYSKNRGTALYEIRNSIREESIPLKEKDVLEALEEHNHFLNKYFYNKDNWKLAQFVDSQIATKIMLHFANMDEACLCYHDSFIVKKRFQNELINVMRDSWDKVLGNTDNFKYDVEF